MTSVSARPPSQVGKSGQFMESLSTSEGYRRTVTYANAGVSIHAPSIGKALPVLNNP